MMDSVEVTGCNGGSSHPLVEGEVDVDGDAGGLEVMMKNVLDLGKIRYFNRTMMIPCWQLVGRSSSTRMSEIQVEYLGLEYLKYLNDRYRSTKACLLAL